MNPATRLSQIIETMETEVTVEQYGQFCRCLSRIGGDNKKTPAAVKLVNMMHAAGQFLGVEDPEAKKEVVDLLATLGNGLSGVVDSPESTSDPVGPPLAECQKAFAEFKARFDARPLVSPEEMEGLKEVILSVDWEISDETLQRFDRVTTTLVTRLRFHRTLYPFLKIINSLGRYMSSKKAAAHKDSVSFLQSVFQHFEQVAQNPAMPFKDKKRLIEQDIAAFNAFKEEISRPDPGPELSVRPALSHVNAPRIHSGHTLTPLENSAGPEPALASLAAGQTGKGVSMPDPSDRDVMGDLFNPKENDADRLMDRIHRSLVTGQDAGGPDADDPEGFENLVPRRMDQNPIPEISSRLDEFFNLEASRGDGTADADDSGQTFDDTTPLFEGEEEPPEKLILLEPEDEPGQTPDTAQHGTEAPAPPDRKIEKLALFTPGDDPVDAAMDRLGHLATAPTLDGDSLAGIGGDLALLKSLWQGDPDKRLLVDLALRLLGEVGSESGQPLPVPESPSDQGAETEPETEPETESRPLKSRKFWPVFGRRRGRHAK